MLTAYERFRAKTMAFAEATKPESQRCWLFHRWQRWADIAAYLVTSSEGRTIGTGVEQHRRCARCNRLATRRVQTTIFDRR